MKQKYFMIIRENRQINCLTMTGFAFYFGEDYAKVKAGDGDCFSSFIEQSSVHVGEWFYERMLTVYQMGYQPILIGSADIPRFIDAGG